MTPLSHGSLFTGIGGLDPDFARTEFSALWLLEIDARCLKLLRKNPPAPGNSPTCSLSAQTRCPPSTSSPPASPARFCPWRTNATASRKNTLDYFMNSSSSSPNFALVSLCGKTFRTCSLPTKTAISRASSMPWQTSGITGPGGVLTLNTSEGPSADEGSSACSLKEILAPYVAPKYSLSPKACTDILRRAAKQGKPLPAPPLAAALRAVADAQPTSTDTELTSSCPG